MEVTVNCYSPEYFTYVTYTVLTTTLIRKVLLLFLLLLLFRKENQDTER